jgi:hypothetical protein
MVGQTSLDRLQAHCNREMSVQELNMSTVQERKDFEATNTMKVVMGKYFASLCQDPAKGKKTA